MKKIIPVFKSISMLNDELEKLWKTDPSDAEKMSESIFSNPKIKKDRFFYLNNGHHFRKSANHKTAHKYFAKATALNPADELASLCKYLELVKLHRYNYAIKELDRYLTAYTADAYKVTLEELLEDMEKGVAVKYKLIVIKHCKKNKIRIKPSLKKALTK